MTCLPTTRAGMEAAIAWYAAARIIAQFDAGVQPTAKPQPARTTQEAIDRVVARVRGTA